MLKDFVVNVFLKRRHFWRYADFDDISKLYTARTLRDFSLRLVMTFLSVYLYNLGYPLAFIFTYLAIYYVMKIPMTVLAGYVVVRIGPRHSTFYANILYIPTILAMIFLNPPGDITTLWILGGIILLQSFSAALYEFAMMLNYAKMKGVQGVGKQLGMMQMLEKIAGIVAPVVGGVIASWLGPEILMIIASVILGLAALPLASTTEPINKTQKIRWRKFPWKRTWRNMLAQVGAGYDYVTSGSVWQLYLVVMVFTVSKEIYAVVGALSSIATFAALISAYAFGKLIDKNRGRQLLKWGVYFKAITNFMRPTINTPIGAASASAVAEISSTAYSMAFMRGLYDTADRHSYRLNYLMLMAIAVDGGAAIANIIAMIFFLVAAPTAAFPTFFFLSAFITLLIAMPKFPLYKH